MVQVGDKIRFVSSLGVVPDWDGTIVTRITDEYIHGSHPKMGTGSFYPHQVIPYEPTDEELAAAYREARAKTVEAFNELTKRGYTFRNPSGQLLYRSEDVTITKNVQKSL